MIDINQHLSGAQIIIQSTVTSMQIAAAFIVAFIIMEWLSDGPDDPDGYA